MAQQNINIGTADAKTGDTYFDAFTKIEDNFTDLYSVGSVGARVIVETIDDLPTPVLDTITLEANTQYFFVDSVNLGINVLIFQDLSTISGVDNNNITITYEGAGTMITGTDVTMRVQHVTLSAPSGTLFEWTETGGQILRINDVSYNCQRFSTFTGTSGIIRCTNVSGTCALGGVTFSGNFRSFLWEVSAATMTAGTMFNLVAATFDSWIADKVLLTLNGASIGLSGSTGSANINANGQGTVITVLTNGTGTPLVLISQDDALWKMYHNDDIPDTSRTATGYIIGSAAVTTIGTISTPVKVNFGTGWIAGKQQQWVSDNTGRHTYTGPDQSFHVTGSVFADTVSGTNKVYRWYIAKNGVVDASSVSQRSYDSANPGSVPITAVVDMSTGNFIEIYVENITDTTDVNAETVNLVLEG